MNSVKKVLDSENELAAIFAFGALITSAVLSPTINLALGIGAPSTGDGSLTRVIIYTLIFGISAKATIKPADFKTWWSLPISMTLCIAWFFLSLFWAINPEIGLRRLALTIVVTWTTFALVRVIKAKIAFDLIRVIFLLILLFNYIAVFLFPNIGITDDTFAWLAGAWHGILGEKNHAGAVTALTVLLFMFGATHIKWSVRLVVLIAAFYFLYRTTSKTSLGLAVVATALGCSLLFYKPYYRLVAITSLMICVVLVLIAIGVYSNSVVGFLNEYMSDPESLTGRVQIWPVLWDYFQENWLLGAGFGSFWNIGAESPIFVGEGWVTEIASGHNGYLDILVQVGLPGLLIVFFAAFISPASQIIWFKQLDPQRSALIVSILFFCFAHNLTETTLFDRDSIVFIFILLAIAALERVHQDER